MKKQRISKNTVSIQPDSRPVTGENRTVLLAVQSFARRIGVDVPTIVKIIDTHKEIEYELPTVCGNYRIDLHKWEPVFKKIIANECNVGTGKGNIPRGKKAQALMQVRDTSDDDYEGEGGPETPDNVVTYSDVRTKRELFTAKKAELEYRRAAGKLINAKAVERAWQNIAVSVQKAVLTVPDRVTPLLVGEVDQTIIHNRITTELKYALKNLSFSLNETADLDAERVSSPEVDK
jgi:phage terminase Nu1 subunit (DNA packaging protein)